MNYFQLDCPPAGQNNKGKENYRRADLRHGTSWAVKVKGITEGAHEAPFDHTGWVGAESLEIKAPLLIISANFVITHDSFV